MDVPASRLKFELPELQIFHDCIYSPEHNGLYDLDGNLVPSLYRGRNRKKIPDTIKVPPLESMETIDSALFGGILFPCHFGHFLTESMARLWPFHFNDLLENRNVPILFRAASSTPVAVSDLFLPAKNIFSAIGLLGQLRIEDRYLHVRKMIVPEPSLLLGDMIYQVHADFLQAIGEKVLRNSVPRTQPVGERIYYSRSNVRAGYGRKYVNEKRLEGEMKCYGYSVIQPEGLSLAEQIQVFNNSLAIVGPVGSAFFTILLAQKNAVEVTLFLENTNGLIDYINIAGAAGVTLHLITCVRNHPLSFNKKENSGDKVVDINGAVRLMKLQ